MVESDLVAAIQADRSLNTQDLSRLVSDYITCIVAFCLESFFLISCFLTFSEQIGNYGPPDVLKLW
jgi:hypothetical protein